MTDITYEQAREATGLSLPINRDGTIPGNTAACYWRAVAAKLLEQRDEAVRLLDAIVEADSRAIEAARAWREKNR